MPISVMKLVWEETNSIWVRTKAGIQRIIWELPAVLQQTKRGNGGRTIGEKLCPSGARKSDRKKLRTSASGYEMTLPRASEGDVEQYTTTLILNAA